ncbi:MAG TPA: hypothetical protein VGM14_26785 [Streptosporangiaceae bacterium]
MLISATATSLGAVATLATGVTFGLFSASVTSAPNEFSSGSVTLGTPTQVTCHITSMLPGQSSTNAPIGDNTDAPCTYDVTYTGSTDAYLAVDISVYNPSTTAPDLYDGSDSGLQLYLADTTHDVAYVTGDTVAAPTKGTTFLADTGTGTPTQTTLPLNAAPTGGPPVYHSTQDLLSTAAPVASGATVALNLDYAIPTGSGAFNGGDADVVLTIHAVQDTSSNVLACTTITTPTVGAQCLAGTDFAWS